MVENKKTQKGETMKLVYPNFTKGRILKIAMLENLRDYSRDTLEVLSSRLSDGIVEGFQPIVNENIITFNKGIIKYGNEIYLVSENLTIDYGATDVEVLIKLVFLEQSNEIDYKTQEVSLTLDKNTKVLDNEIELGRFKLKEGAYLRTKYKDLDDYTTEYNTINLINVKYASIDEHTITPSFMREYGKEILKTKTKDVWDITFATSCISENKVTRELIKNYISTKLNDDSQDLNNYKLHQKLVEVLRKVRTENRYETNTKRDRKTILVD